jgi:glutamate-1-semialdehyde aminotransferase
MRGSRKEANKYYQKGKIMGRSQEYYIKAKTLIPGGTQLLSKRPEMFLPDGWPAYYSKAKGCEVWDLDGNKYVDMTSMGIGCCILGYADDDINVAVKSVIDSGNMASLNAPEEVELAQLLCELHPWAQMVRYSRTGGEAMAIAVRIARAYTKKDKVLFCGYHGWHDWYLAANLSENSALDGHLLPGLSPVGVPRPLKGLSYPFNFNDTKEFIKLASEHKSNICAIVLEAIRNDEPEKEFIEAIKSFAKEQGIVFIVDEITSGFRLNVGGAHLLHGYTPDIAVFAKGISNGYPMSAIIGRGNIMQSAQDSFISSTYWTDKIGPAAALAAINKMKKYNVPAHLIKIGKQIQDGWTEKANKNGLKIHVSGIYPLSHFAFEDGQDLALKTLFTQSMLEKGFLASTMFYSSFAHKEEHVRGYLNAVDETFAILAGAVKDGNPEKLLKGPVCHSGFKRLN